MTESIKFMIKNWFKWDKTSLLYFFLRIPALVLQPIVTAYIPKAIIDCIETGVTVRRLFLIVALLSLLLTFTIWIDPFMKELIRGGARIIRMRYAIMAFRKNLSTAYVNVESLDGREQYKRAESFYNARFASGADFIEECNNFLVCIIGVITSSVLIYKINFYMILLILITCIGEFFILRALNKKQKNILDKNATLATKLDYFYKLSKSSDASKDIKLYGFQDYFIYSIVKLVSKIESVVAKYTHQSASISGIRAVLNLLRQGIAYIYLIYLVTAGRLVVSEFIFYFGIITGFSNWIVNLVFTYSKIECCVNDCTAFRSYVEKEEENKNQSDVSFNDIHSIEFQNVKFTYPSSDRYVINNMSFKVKKGENIAIVGENGAGKTTAIKLLCGLYCPTEGEILINGKSNRKFSNDSYFNLFSAVFQDYFFMPMTIAQNICAELNYDKKRLYLALKAAGILDKILVLPEKENSFMDKNVFKNAVNFSGGEKQKLLLAKAIYKNAPILILDEPTAALDPISENELYLKYRDLTQGKISFFISHRLSSTRFCDRILFIKDGTVAETGTHDELMALKGLYYQMFQIQSYYYKEQGVILSE